MAHYLGLVHKTISAIAKEIAHRFNDEYVAGLWRNNLLNELLWKSEQRDRNGENHCPATGPKTYRAPSWSWAAIDGEYGFSHLATYGIERKKYKDLINTARVIDVSVTPVSHDSTGRVSDGHLILCAPQMSDLYDKFLPKSHGVRPGDHESWIRHEYDLDWYRQHTRTRCHWDAENRGGRAEALSLLEIKQDRYGLVL